MWNMPPQAFRPKSVFWRCSNFAYFRDFILKIYLFDPNLSIIDVDKAYQIITFVSGKNTDKNFELKYLSQSGKTVAYLNKTIFLIIEKMKYYRKGK